MKKLTLTCAILFSSLCAVAAQAQTLTFEVGGLIDNGTFEIDSLFDNDISGFGSFPTDVFGWCAEDCGGLNVVTLNRVDNAPFSISAVDIAALSNVGNGNPMVVTGNLSGGGSVVANLVLPLVADTLETRALTGFNDVVSVTFSKQDTFGEDLADAAIDNVVLGAAVSPAPARPVPAMPLSILLLTALGTILLGRKRLRINA